MPLAARLPNIVTGRSAVLLAVAMLLAGCAATSPTPAARGAGATAPVAVPPSIAGPVPPSPDASGHAGWSFSGTGSGQTPSFTVNGPLSVEYTFAGSGILAVLSAVGGVAVASIVDRTGPGHQSTWVYGASGDVSLDVTSGSPWTITVTMTEPPVARVPVRLAGTTGETTAPIAFLGAEAVAWTYEGTGAFRIDAVDPADGSTVEQLVNTVGAGSKTIAFGPRGTYALAVVADGPWSVSVKPGD